jgi:hypothetical protein
MNKDQRKLTLHRETVLRLDDRHLLQAAGGRAVAAELGIDTSCGEACSCQGCDGEVQPAEPMQSGNSACSICC